MKAWRYYQKRAGIVIPFDPDLSFKPGIQVIQLFVPSKIIYHPAKEMQKEKITNNLFFATIGIVLSLLKSLKKYLILPGLTPPPPFLKEPPPFFWVPPSFFSRLKVTPSFWELFKLVHVKCIKQLKMKVLNFLQY